MPKAPDIDPYAITNHIAMNNYDLARATITATGMDPNAEGAKAAGAVRDLLDDAELVKQDPERFRSAAAVFIALADRLIDGTGAHIKLSDTQEQANG